MEIYVIKISLFLLAVIGLGCASVWLKKKNIMSIGGQDKRLKLIDSLYFSSKDKIAMVQADSTIMVLLVSGKESKLIHQYPSFENLKVSSELNTSFAKKMESKILENCR